jgi:hypothetical protein
MRLEWEPQETSGRNGARYLDQNGIHGIIYYNDDDVHWNLVLWMPSGLMTQSDGFSSADEAERDANMFIEHNA